MTLPEGTTVGVGGITQSETVQVVVLCLGLNSPTVEPPLGPEEADALSRHRFTLLQTVLDNHGTAAIESVPDGLMVVFTSTLAALTCAVRMQQVMASDNEHQGPGRAVGIRIGLSIGEAVCEKGNYTGSPVIEAARLCALAQGGQILASALVKASAGRRQPFRFAAAGALVTKDIAEPVETLALMWDSIPLPGGLGTVPDISRVVGRESQNDLLTQTYKRVAAGRGREVVLVSGEPGVGKSTLVAGLARRAFELGACVLVGHHDEELTSSYQGFAEAIGHYVAHASPEVLQAHVDADGAELSIMVPDLGQRLEKLPANRSADPDTMRYLVFSAVVGLFTKASTATPLVLILEDLQWGDTQSLQLLRHLVRESDASRAYSSLAPTAMMSPRLPLIGCSLRCAARSGCCA